MNKKAAVITISDKGYKKEREDTSGPALVNLLTEDGWDIEYTSIVPDEKEDIKRELLHCSDDLEVALVLTTGGTGFAKRDVTPEATLEVMEKNAPGIAELMRAKSMEITPNGCLSRGVSVIRNNTLIINMPGSEKAVVENYEFIKKPIGHGIKMLLSEGSAECAANETAVKIPSMDEWIKEAKADADAKKCGMYLFHNGVVRETAKKQVREGIESDLVVEMNISVKHDDMAKVIEETKKLPGIFYARAWVREGKISVSDDIMYVLVGGDIRPHVIDALQYLVGRLKNECILEEEIYE